MSAQPPAGPVVCLVCAEDIVYVAVGPCNHRDVCHLCSLRLRAFYDIRTCSYCKTEQDRVVYTSDTTTPYEDLVKRKYPLYSKAGINALCQNQDLFNEVTDLLKYECPNCQLLFNSRGDAEKHIRKDHPGLFLCHICLDNRKLFFYEHKLFTKAQLDRHMRQGDDDDPSFRGHATCAFDKKTFFGKDDLYNHLERDHYHCFICRSNGVYNQYYDDYPNLEQHFDQEHFLCPYVECKGLKFIAFATDIGLKRHLASEHMKDRKMSRAQQRQFLTIQLDPVPQQQQQQQQQQGGRQRNRPQQHQQQQAQRSQQQQYQYPQGSNVYIPPPRQQQQQQQQQHNGSRAAGDRQSTPTRSARAETVVALEEIDSLVVDGDDEDVVLVDDGQDVESAIAEKLRVEETQREEQARENRRRVSRTSSTASSSSDAAQLASSVNTMRLANNTSPPPVSSGGAAIRPPPGFEGRAPSGDGTGRPGPPPGLGGASVPPTQAQPVKSSRIADLKKRAPQSFSSFSSGPAQPGKAESMEEAWSGQAPSAAASASASASTASPNKLQVDLESDNQVSAFASISELDPLTQRKQAEFAKRLQAVFGTDRHKMDQFRAITRAFRAGSLSAAHFHEQWLAFLGPNSPNLFGQLVELIPEAELKRQLLGAHHDHKARTEANAPLELPLSLRVQIPTAAVGQSWPLPSSSSSASSSSSSSSTASSARLTTAHTPGRARVLVIKKKEPSKFPAHNSLWEAAALARPYMCPNCGKTVPAADKEWHIATHLPAPAPSSSADGFIDEEETVDEFPELPSAPKTNKSKSKPKKTTIISTTAAPRSQTPPAATKAPVVPAQQSSTAWANGSAGYGTGSAASSVSLHDSAFPSLQASTGRPFSPAPTFAPIARSKSDDSQFPALVSSSSSYPTPAASTSTATGNGKKKQKKTVLYIG